MRYLIDGYNLLYSLGLARRNGGRAAWDRGRRQLLDWLADRHGATANQVTVIFDAQNSLGGVVEETHRGLRVIRDRGRTADDLIEDMLRQESSPETLTVVSNDVRVRDAARRRRCHISLCDDYVDALVNGGRPAESPPAESEKPTGISAKETADFLKAFGQ